MIIVWTWHDHICGVGVVHRGITWMNVYPCGPNASRTSRRSPHDVEWDSFPIAPYVVPNDNLVRFLYTKGEKHHSWLVIIPS